MSTHCGITVRVSPTERFHVYNHCDGHIPQAGLKLFKYFNSLERAKELVSQGNISKLHKNIDPDPSQTHDFYNYQPNTCVFYTRDRQDEGEEFITLSNADATPDYEFNYYFDGKEWFVRGEGRKHWKKLTPELVKANLITLINLTYGGNDEETYTLYLSDVPYAELLVGEDAAIEIVSIVKQFIYASDGDVIDIKNDDEKLGLIVDIWDEDQFEVIDSLTIWFDDFSDY